MVAEEEEKSKTRLVIIALVVAFASALLSFISLLRPTEDFLAMLFSIKQPISKIVCIGEYENECPGKHHDAFFTCGYYPNTDDLIAQKICLNKKAVGSRINTSQGGHCGYGLVEAICPAN